MQQNEKQIFLEFPISKNSFYQKNPTCLSRGYSPLSGIYGHTTVYNSAMHSFYVYGGVSYSAGRVQVSNALFVLHYPTRRWSVVSTGCHKNTVKCIFNSFKSQLNSEWIYELIFSPKMQTKNYKNFCPTIQTRILALFFGDFLATILVCLVRQKSL